MAITSSEMALLLGSLLLLALLSYSSAKQTTFEVSLGPAIGRAHAPAGSAIPATMYWRVDYGSEGMIFAEIHVPALAPTSWFAFGLSDRGEPAPADYCILWTDWKGRVSLSDAWADEDGRLTLDQSQDCRDFLINRHGDSVQFAFSREFDTCDSRDYIIEDGTTHIVWSTGIGPLYRITGLDIVGQAEFNGMVRVQLLKTLGPDPLVPEEVFHGPTQGEIWRLEITAQKVPVPPEETTYWCHVQRLPDQLRKKHHVIQYEPVIQPGNEALVHHMEVFHCEQSPSVEVPSYKGSCSARDRPEETIPCKRVLAAWAMGAASFVYPQETGLPIGGAEFNPYVMLEVHYNNPELRSDWVDSSGVRLYLSPKLRHFDGGVMELGLEYTDKMAIPPSQMEFPLTGHCISECTAVETSST